jgi:hypothetical protein
VHDASVVNLEFIDELKLRSGINKINIVGDKGYIINDAKRKIILKKNVKITFPYRSNQIRQNTPVELIILKKRHCVENFFATLKQFKKIQLRYDSKIKSYAGFVNIALICISFKTILKKS